jgi:putative flippase GtrA
MKFVVLYILLAALSTIANIGSQDIAIRIYTGIYSVELSILVGTAVGLLVKYALDKRFIFRFQARDVVHETRTFAIYTFMGAFTTLIFWGFEYGFHHLFQSKELRYLGGVIGLAIGYATKYQLDKRFVFKNIDAVPD